MQLKGKKIWILSTIFVYFASFFMQSNFVFFQTWANDRNKPLVNIVAILVDDAIYDSISGGVSSYAEYVQKKISSSKALIMPLDLKNITAYDIHRMMENIYFDGLKDVNSHLVGLVMIGDIPLPVVNQDGYVFPTVYPYVDFEDQKYVWDPGSKYFVPNGNLGGQAEIWHGLINYGSDASAYAKFFDKIEKYDSNPDEFIGDSMWYEDFIADKQGFIDENFQYYRNMVMFGEDIGYQRYAPLMKKLFGGESMDEGVEILSDLGDAMGLGLDWATDTVLEQLKSQGTQSMHTTKMDQQEIKDGYLSDYSELFSKMLLSAKRENIFAGGRWIKTYDGSDNGKSLEIDADSSASMIQLKDTLYLGNDDLEGVIQNLNDLLEKMVDDKIKKERYDMDIVIPVEYEKVTKKRAYLRRFPFVSRWENFYFGKSARYIDSAQELSIYRGTFRNLTGLGGVTYKSLLSGKNPLISEKENTNLKFKSIGASYGIFSQQVEGNRGYTMLKVEQDLDTYDQNVTRADDKEKTKNVRGLGVVRRKYWPDKCDGKKCETFPDFVQRRWGGASPINLNPDSISEGRYELNGYKATDSWRSIYDMGGFQSLLTGKDEGISGTGWTTGSQEGPQWEATNYTAYMKYASPTQVEGWNRARWGFRIYENHIPNVHTGFVYSGYGGLKLSDMKNWKFRDYWLLDSSIVSTWNFNKESERIFTIEPPSKSSSSLLETLLRKKGNIAQVSSFGSVVSSSINSSTSSSKSEKYTYKFLSSIVKHTSTTDDEINGIDYDKYGENGKAGIYYSSVLSAYSGVYKDTQNVVLSGEESLDLIKDNESDLINGIGSGLDSLILGLDAKKSQLNMLEFQLSQVGDGTGSEEEKEIIIEQINAVRSGMSEMEVGLGDYLSGMLNIVYEDHVGLVSLYVLIGSLFADSIITALEHIIYTEGGEPDDYISAGSDCDIKIQLFGPGSDGFGSIKSSILENKNKILKLYDDVYTSISKQKNWWDERYKKLVEICDDEENKHLVDNINEGFKTVFTFEFSYDDGEEKDEDADSDYNGEELPDRSGTEIINFDQTTAKTILDDFASSLDEADTIISNLVEGDVVGPKIVQAAKSDKDFLKWAGANEIVIGKLSDQELIKQYDARAKGPGYDSEGAKKNHDLLLGISEHMSGMNILTPDRPIDSPRYVTMQSIAGREMKLIYPDLFNVEVFILTGKNKSGFDIHELMTGGQIKKSLEKYLKGKVSEYNAIILAEYAAAKTMDIYSNRIYNFDPYATPDKSVHPYKEFTYDDFLEALGGEKMLDVIADVLYYQNLTNKKKLSTGAVEGDIEFIKDSFNLNDKREYVLEDYLTFKNKKNKLLLIPNYEMTGYEVAYVNSNGGDYIIPSEDISQDVEKASGDGILENDMFDNERKQPTTQEEEMNDECGIPRNGLLPLFEIGEGSPWYKGFKCWLKKTIEEPVKIKLKFDSSLGEVLVNSGMKGLVKGLWEDQLKEPFTDWGDAMSKYSDAWHKLLDKGTGFDATQEIVQKEVDAEKHNKEVISQDTGIGNGLSDWSKDIKITNSNGLISDNNLYSLLEISSVRDIGNITVKFEGFGDGCLLLNDKNLCEGFSKTFNPKTNPFTGLVTTSDHIAGADAIDMKIYLGSDYLEKVIKYSVSPSVLSDVVINLGDNKTVAGMVMPMEVIGYDKYKNRIEWELDKYDFVVSQGRFLKDGAYQSGFTTNDFRDLRFYYNAPLDAVDNSEVIFKIVKASNHNKVLGTSVWKVVQGSPEIKLNDTIILEKKQLETNQVYRLKSDENIYGSNGEVSPLKLQKLDIDMKDLKGELIDIDSQILVTSKNGLVVIGQIQKDENGKNVFFETSMNNMVSGHVTLYYYPTTVAGDDVIEIDIPGLQSRLINLSVKPASLYSVELRPEDDVLQLGDSMWLEVFLYDIWGNTLDGSDGLPIMYDEDKIYIQGGSDGYVTVGTLNGYGKISIFGTGAGLTYITTINGEYAKIIVDKHIFPESGLNILYLNYFGDDWGNQWGYFSKNDNYIEKVMDKSKKVITTTTQLVSEDKIKKMVWKIEPGFRIQNLSNVNTILNINSEKIDMIIGGISNMTSKFPSLKRMQVTNDTIENILSNPKTSSQNYAFFIPSESNYFLSGGVLYDSGNVYIGNILNGELPLKLSNYSMNNGDNIWNIVYKGVNYGSVVLHVPGFSPKIPDFIIPGERYIINSTFTDGSTYELSSVGIFDNKSSFEVNSSYKSIQDSDDYTLQIGFLGDFKNITLFAEGEIVGEATKKFGSELLINLGDPVLSRKPTRENDKVYGTKFDGGIGQELYVDSEDDIFGTYPISLNGGDPNDLLVIYLDGSIKLAKSYGGEPDLRNMQELMRISSNIKDVFVGDVNGDRYMDILIRTTNDQLRVYLNQGGIFEVDGHVACLNINVFEGQVASEPMNLSELYKLYAEDMNQDSIMDIVTYDHKGYIKVFYGGSTNGYANYLSKEKYTCDTGWYDREIKNTVIVDALGLQVTPGVPIYDNSMMSWVGMGKDEIKIEESDLPDWGITYDQKLIQGKIKDKRRKKDSNISEAVAYVLDNTDVDKASQQGIDEYMKYQEVSLYENQLVGGGKAEGDNNYIFEPISFLDPGNPKDSALVWKTYKVMSGGAILQDGDIVRVTVTVYAKKPFVGTFGDKIQGPWRLYYDEKNIFKGIEILENTGNAVILKRDGNFSYLVDNIRLFAGQSFVFQYDLEYADLQIKDIDITYKTFWSDDDFPDIKLKSVDGCVKDFDAYINKGRLFSKKVIPLQKLINDEYAKAEADSEDYASVTTSVGSNVNALPGIQGDKINRVKLLQGGSITNDGNGKSKLSEMFKDSLGEMGLSFELSLFEEQTSAIENVLDDIMKGMCNGYSFGGSNNCKGLPVPFNQAFFAPGKYHLFGCWELPLGILEKGLPVFFFPGTLQVGPISVPFPNALKSAADKFLWVPGGTYPSFIRIYAAPTLTAQLGIAVCMGPYAVGAALKSPFADIGGNCVVFAVKPQCKNSEKKNDNMDPDNPNQTYSPIMEDVRDSTTCLQYQKGTMVTKRGQRSSVFELYSYNSSYTEAGPSRDEIMVDEDQVDDILADIQAIAGSTVNVRDAWDKAMKGTLKGPRIGKVSLSVFDWVFGRDKMDQWVDELYDKYFADAELKAIENGATYGYPNYSTSFMGIIDLEIDASVAADEDTQETKNSIVIGDVDVLGGDFTVNKIRGGIQQGLRKILIDNWLDPQIRYILNQLTKMHVIVKLPDMSNLIANEIDTIKNVGNNIGDVWANLDDSSVDKKMVEDEKNKTLVSKWSNFTYQNLNEYNRAIANPFDSLASLMNQSNIVNITTEPLIVKVPMIFSEDVAAYKVYLQQRLEVNQGIMDDWWEMLNAFGISCSKKETKEEQQKCKEDALNNIASFELFRDNDWTRMQNQIYTNIMILEEYRNFPFEIYEWIHVIDRYMSEIASLINNTIGYLSYRTTTNSERFVGYVDAIVLILNIIKTYQVIIDFSVDWSKNCGNCAKDTYDQYSCKLSLLCNGIKLPIIQIPNFKLPNITIDLSNIDLGLDIVLPEFNFQPIRIDLPDLPNLPEPPSVSMDIRLFNLPNIPQLPEPPELPELPSFIPEVELELPILPPAPELPRLPNEIESLIKVAKLIGRIYCIVKGEFGLVGETSVKAKIEQLTQRTYDVDWIDNIMDFTNWTAAPIKNYGVDYEISAYLDLQFDFDYIYAYLDALTKGINNLTTSAADWTQKQVDKTVDNSVMERIDNKKDYIDGVNYDVDMTLFSLNDSDIKSETDSFQYDLTGLESDEVEYVDYSTAKNRLNEVLAYFSQEIDGSNFRDSYKSSIKKIENQVNTSNEIQPNIEGINTVKDSVIDYINDQQANYNDLANLINDDYDSFLAMVNSQSVRGLETKSESNSGKVLAFNVQLFNLDSTTKENIEKIKTQNPYKSLLDNKMDIIDGYWNAITTKTPSDLGLSETQYLVLRDNIGKMKKDITSLYSIAIPTNSSKLIPKNGGTQDTTLLASSNAAVVRDTKSKTITVDAADFSDGIYDRIEGGVNDGQLTKVVYADSFATLIGDRYYNRIHYVGDNILMWTEKAIYKKCPGQKCSSGEGFNKKTYVYHVKSVPYEEKWIKFDSDTILKIADGDPEIKDWQVLGQTYDVLSLSWKLSNVDAYLIKLVDRVDSSYEKSDYDSTADVKYVLALPDGVNIDELYENKVLLELLKKTDKIEDLIGNELVEIVHYDKNKETAIAMISNIERKWYYARIATLKMNYSKSVYEINSPWSNQIVAGQQIVGDDQHPLGDAELYRPSVAKVVSEGDDLEGYVGTWYTLNINWKDNVALSYINISQDGKILAEKYTTKSGDVISVDGLFQTGSVKEYFTTMGIDHFGNKTEKLVTVSYYIPEITITDVSKKGEEGDVRITAELSQDIDQGDVSFQRRRGDTWKTMRKIDRSTEIPLEPGKAIVVGEPYSAGTKIAMYGKDGEVIAFMDSNTAEITIQPKYKDDYEVQVGIEDSTTIKVCNKKSGKVIFDINIPIKEVSRIEADGYTVVPLPEKGNMGMFNGGQAIYKDGLNILFISPTGRLYSEIGMTGAYSYDREQQQVVFTLYLNSDKDKKYPIKIWLEIEPLVE